MLTRDVYPELSKYLKENEAKIVAKNLCCKEEEFSYILGMNSSPSVKSISAYISFLLFSLHQSDTILSNHLSFSKPEAIRNLIKGKRKKVVAEQNEEWANNIWEGLQKCCNNPEILEILAHCNKKGSEHLYQRYVCGCVGSISIRAWY